MSARVRFRFACDAGAGVGFGHLMRCLTLAREAHARGLAAELLLAGDAAAHERARAVLPDLPITRWCTPDDAAGAADWLVFDTRRALDAPLDAAHGAGVACVVLDRLDQLTRARWTVLPIPHPPALEHPRLLAGRPFCMLAPEVRALRPVPLAARDRILVTFGGADPLDLTGAVAEPFQQALDWLPVSERLPVHAVLGPGFRAPDRLRARLEKLGWQVSGPLSRGALMELARHARFALTGYGTTVYELAFLGVPCLYWTHHRTDLEAAARLERAGLGALAGFGVEGTPRELRARLAETLLDPAWRAAAAARGRDAVGDGRGAARLLDHLADAPIREDAA